MRSEYYVGARVRSLRDFVGVPKGTEGVIDEDYGDGMMVAWDLPDKPLPPGYQKHDGRPAVATRILRDGFGNEELGWLEVVPAHFSVLWKRRGLGEPARGSR
jgi:hypothetical protein